MRREDHFVISWSGEDQCYVGRCPDLFLGEVHGEDPDKVFKELRELGGIGNQDPPQRLQALAGTILSARIPSNPIERRSRVSVKYMMPMVAWTVV